jgi:phytoene dehydrogenase-like protein
MPGSSGGSQPQRRVIIIGAGIAGLSAGCFAQMNGYSSRIFEHHSKAGGVAAAWRRGKYLVDGGIHFIMDPGSEIYREVGTCSPDSLAPMHDYGRFTDETTGKSVTATSDLALLRSELKRLSPDDGRLIDTLLDAAAQLRGLDMGMMSLSRPPELAGALDNLKMVWKMRALLKFMTGKYARTMDEFAGGARDPFLRDCLRNLFLPEVPVWFIVMVLALLADQKVALLKGGCPEFVGPIEKKYRELGGAIQYKATVEKILVENGKACGVRLDDGTEHRSDIVISAADGHSTLFGMLGGAFAGRDVRERYSKWKLTRPMLTVSYGVKREFSGEPHFSIVLLKKPLTIAGKPQNALSLRILNYGKAFAPEGSSIIQAIPETEWKPWNDLRARDRAGYEAEKKRVAKEILERLDERYPGIANDVEMTDVATPYTTWRYTRNHEGAWGGWLITPGNVTKTLRITLPGLKDFYLAGQWAVAGGSVPGCIYSGRNAIELICKREGRPFRADAKR